MASACCGLTTQFTAQQMSIWHLPYTCAQYLALLAEEQAWLQVWLVGTQGDWKGKVRVELSVMRHEQTPAMMGFRAHLPEWTTCASFTTFQKSFQF